MTDLFPKFSKRRRRISNKTMKEIATFICHPSGAASRLDPRLTNEQKQIRQFLDGFRPRNRTILEPLEWLACPTQPWRGQPCKGWTAKVVDDHPAWGVW